MAKALTKTRIEYEGYTLAGNYKALYKCDDVAKASWVKNGTDVGNYEINCDFGDLIITKRDVKYVLDVQANSSVFTYNGQQHKVEGCNVVVGGSKYKIGEKFILPDNGEKYSVVGLGASRIETDANETG